MCGLAIVLLSITCSAEPFKPANDSIVVERLPRSLVALRKSPRVGTLDPPAQRISLAREYLEIAQRTGDVAFVRYAEEMLARTGSEGNPDVLFLLAVINQHKHEFDTALDQLTQVQKLAPLNQEAALLSASILTTQGRYDEAKAVFAKNLRLTSTLRGLTIFLTLASLSGNLEKSELMLAHAINSAANTTEQAFAWCAVAEMAARRGDSQAAEERSRRSLELEPGDSYTLAAYCDLLLARGRNTEVLAKIESHGTYSTSEALLTRRFLAMKASRAQVMPFLDQLKMSGHWRELAMLQLDVMHDSEAALESASRNWRNQKEPIDALLLVRSALTCRTPSSAEPVKTWLATTKMQDSRLDALQSIPTCDEHALAQP